MEKFILQSIEIIVIKSKKTRVVTAAADILVGIKSLNYRDIMPARISAAVGNQDGV